MKSRIQFIIFYMVTCCLTLFGQHASTSFHPLSTKRLFFKTQFGAFFNSEQINPFDPFEPDPSIQSTYDFTKASFRRISYGFGWIKNNQLSELSIEGNHYIIVDDDDWGRSIEKTKLLVELEFLKSFKLYEANRAEFYPGFVTAISFDLKEFNPHSNNSFGIEQYCFCASVGIELNLKYQIINQVSLFLSSKFNFIELGYYYSINYNPNLFVSEAQFSNFSLGFLDHRKILDFGFLYEI